MPVRPMNVWDRLRQSLRPKDATTEEGNYALETIKIDGWNSRVQGAVAGAAQVTRAAETERRHRVHGFDVASDFVAAKNIATVSFAIGAAVYQSFIASGADRFSRDFQVPLVGDLGATLLFIAGPGGASVSWRVNVYGDTVSG